MWEWWGGDRLQSVLELAEGPLLWAQLMKINKEGTKETLQDFMTGTS